MARRRVTHVSITALRLDATSTLRYKVIMNTTKRAIATVEILLVFPAALFMTALFVRNIQPEPFEPAETGRRLVQWFSAKPLLGLDIFLIALPLAALVLGGATVLRSWRSDAELRRAALATLREVRSHLATLLIAERLWRPDASWSSSLCTWPRTDA
jgi:hypothetical protein